MLWDTSAMAGQDDSDNLRQAPANISLKSLAEHLGLSQATVSLVINRSPVADSIAEATKRRILDAVKQFDYRPNFHARSLATRRSNTIGVLVPEISEGYAALVMSGVETTLLERGYCYFVASHHHRSDLVAAYPRMLMERSVEGMILLDTVIESTPSVPTVCVSGHSGLTGVTNVALDHERAASLALDHLFSLGHRRIGLIKGQTFSSDTEIRWQSICSAADRLGIPIRPEWIAQLVGDSSSPQLGHAATRKILSAAALPTAIVAFNDVAAIGAVRAIREFGLSVPQDISVIGFDDIQSAAYQNPSLTTVRQPLRHMGELAAEIVLERITQPHKLRPHTIAVDPVLIVRESTAPVAAKLAAKLAARAKSASLA